MKLPGSSVSGSMEELRRCRNGRSFWRERLQQLQNFDSAWQRFCAAVMGLDENQQRQRCEARADRMEAMRKSTEVYRQLLLESCERAAMASEESFQHRLVAAEKWNRREMYKEETRQRSCQVFERRLEARNRRALAKEDRLGRRAASVEQRLLLQLRRLAARHQRRECCRAAAEGRRRLDAERAAEQAAAGAANSRRLVEAGAKRARWQRVSSRHATMDDLLRERRSGEPAGPGV
mmetsp:Transcript_11226/g.39812  ORF Transcript_11226/g.39812 Transcript_11226/m.39812 type:complete len:235 (-) Transcript_11226:40-744(-)